jgi:hypothetical protein
MRAFIFFLLLPAVAAAAPPSLTGDATTVIVTVPGVRALGEPRVAGDRIELPIEPGAPTSKTYFGKDPTVRKVEILATPAPRVSVQVRHGKGTIEILGGATRLVTEDGEDGAVTLRIPRTKEAAAAAVAAPPAPEPPAVTVEPAAVQVKTVAAAPPPPPPVVVETPAPPPRLTGGPAAAAPPPPLTGVPAGDSPTSPARLLLLGAILCACGAAVVVARRRQAGSKKPASPGSIEVLASRSLGGKTRAVLLSVNDSQMLLAVSDHGARLIHQWYGGEEGQPVADRDIVYDSPLLAMAEPAPSSPDTEPQVPVGVRRPSAAVAGLLKLRREGEARFAGDVARALRASRR